MTDQAGQRVEVRILDDRLREWGLPRHQSEQAAALDLHACPDGPIELAAGAPAILISCGLAIHMNDPHMAALILPRSGLGHRKGLVLGNGTGLIDPDYTAPLMISAWNRNPPGGESIAVAPGDRIAQLIFLPVLRPQLVEVEVFSQPSERGEGGFGSTGVAPADG